MIKHKQLTPEDEYQIVLASLENPKEFKTLYNLYYYDVFRFVETRIHDVNITADIVSEIFYKAISKLRSYKYQGYSIKPWLLRISFNEVMNYFRKGKKERTVSIETDALPELVEEVQDENMMDVTILISALDRLSKDELALIELKFFEKRTYIEISEIIGVSVSNARVKTHRVIMKMRTQLTSTR